MSTRVDVLLCSGLDPSGGAGLIADVRVVTELGGRPSGILTAQTIQNTSGASWSQAQDADVIAAQLTALLSDIAFRGVKIGLIGDSSVAQAIASGLELTDAPVVWDPVSAPTLGDALFDGAIFDDALRALRPHLTMITPNIRELAELTRSKIETLADAIAAARQLAGVTKVAVLVKGGHLDGGEAIDVVIDPRGSELRIEELRGPRISHVGHVHGTGCALSSAIATLLARGVDLIEACRAAKQFVAERIANPVRPGRGAAAIM